MQMSNALQGCDLLASADVTPWSRQERRHNLCWHCVETLDSHAGTVDVSAGGVAVTVTVTRLAAHTDGSHTAWDMCIRLPRASRRVVWDLCHLRGGRKQERDDNCTVVVSRQHHLHRHVA